MNSNFWKGFGLAALLHLLLFLYPPAFILIGIVQFIYLIPAMVIVRKREGMIPGILAASAVTFLLNAACFGIVIGSLNGGF